MIASEAPAAARRRTSATRAGGHDPREAHRGRPRYEIGEIPGFGGMSEVHRARDVRLGRDVAVKVVAVPDVRGQTWQAAIATLQGLGFTIRGPIPTPHPQVPVGAVIDTEPTARTVLAGGDEITLNVSTGPERRTVPHCARLTVADCERSLAAAGFDRYATAPLASTAVPRNLVVTTLQVSNGPPTRRMPDVVGQTADQATTLLAAAGFGLVMTAPVDGVAPAGQVLVTDPPAGTDFVPQSATTLKVSRGNHLPIPTLLGKACLEVVPYLQGFGFVGPLLNGGDAPGADKNRIVRQDPPAGSSITRDGTITVTYGS